MQTLCMMNADFNIIQAQRSNNKCKSALFGRAGIAESRKQFH